MIVLRTLLLLNWMVSLNFTRVGDKNIIFLGQSGYFNHEKGMQLASLQEMLDQPLLKKRLWQFMQKSNHSTDAI